MDFFRVETGTIPGQSCTEETMPMLKRSPRKEGPPLNSKAFCINDSLACIANISLTFADETNQAKDNPIKPSSPVKQNSKPDTSTTPEYRQLSPKNLDKPIYPRGKTNLHAKAGDGETETLLKKGNIMLNITENRDYRSGSKQLEKDEIELKRESSTILALQPDKPSTSSVFLAGDSPSVSGKKKKLIEIANEWIANQSLDLDQPGAKPKMVAMSNADEDDGALVRHSSYYSTASAVHGMSSHEHRLKNRLKTRRHLIRDEVYQEKETSSPALVNYTQQQVLSSTD